MGDEHAAARPRRRRRRGTTEARPVTARRVLLTGADGVVGRALLPRLLAEGQEVVAVAPETGGEAISAGTIRIIADLRRPEWHPWAKGCSSAIHMVPAIGEAAPDALARLEATANVLEGCRSTGVARLVLVSCLGAAPEAPTSLQRTAWKAEDALRRSGLTWTILRPGVVFGSGECLATRLARALRRHAVLPIPGDGELRLQPVASEEVAQAVVAALNDPVCHGQCYELGGPETITFHELARRTARGVRPDLRLLCVPPRFSKAVIALLGRMRPPPLTREELALLQAGATCDPAAALGPATMTYEGPTWIEERRGHGARRGASPRSPR